MAQWVWELRDELMDPFLEKQEDGKKRKGEKQMLLMMLERVCVCVCVCVCAYARARSHVCTFVVLCLSFRWPYRNTIGSRGNHHTH